MQQSTVARLAHNGERIERAATMAGGLMLAGKGVRRGGLLGAVQFVIGGVILARSFNLPRAPAQGSDAQARQRRILDERYSHMPMDSEVQSPDFESDAVTMPDATQMGNEARADRQAGSKPGNSVS